MSLQLKIYANINGATKELVTTTDKGEATFIHSNTTYKVVLSDIDVHKKMYAPGEITAKIQISGSASQGTDKSWFMFSQDNLETFFKGCKVDLKEGSNYVAQGYFVHELIPHYAKDSLYVTLKIYSPDKLLTIDSYCRSFVAKRLFADIMTSELAYFKLPYDKSKSVASLLEKNTLKTLGNAPTNEKPQNKEYILPYLVQFNEPLHNFLVRTANRWGEFLYYEDEKLRIGYDDSAANSNHTVSISDTVSLSYHNMQTDSPVDVAILSHNTVEPSTYTGAFKPDGDGKPHGKYLDETTTEEYRGLVKNEDDYYDQVKHVMTAPTGRWIWKKVGDLFTSAGSVFDWLLTFGIDEPIAASQAEAKNKAKNDKYKDKYFNIADFSAENGLTAEQYNSKSAKDASRMYPFASDHELTDTVGPSSTSYNAVVANERMAGKSVIVIDFGANYKPLSLGSIFKFEGNDKDEYIVIAVDVVTKLNRTLSMKLGKPVEEITKSLEYQVTAVKKQAAGWYPPMHEAGHVRTSGPQVAVVVDNDDPTRNLRYRVRYTWQSSDELATPWLAVANAASTDGGGAYFKHQVGDQLLLDYEGGNVERPYIVGALQKQTPGADKESKVHASTKTNYGVMSTPAGQRITMTDGTGAGLTAFLTNMQPFAKLLKGFAPDLFPKVDADWSLPLEGNVEITDNYGIYSIKASTDERNVSIKSIFGDVKVSAFTGITISAPNGDVKIQGKNVSIEAGNNLTLKSGGNIAKGFMGKAHLGKFSALDVAKAVRDEVTKGVINKVLSYADLSFIRHVLETFLKPIEGTLQVKSLRYLKLESGKGEAVVPVEAYQQAYAEKKTKTSIPKGIYETFRLVNIVVEGVIVKLVELQNQCNQRYSAYHTECSKYNDSCKSAADLADALSDKKDVIVADADLGFKGALSIKDEDINKAIAKAAVDKNPGEDDEAYTARVKAHIKGQRTQARTTLANLARELALSLLEMRNFITADGIVYDVQNVEGCDSDKLKNALHKPNCVNDGEQGVLHKLRNLAGEVISQPADVNAYGPIKTRLKRVVYMNLVKEYKLPRKAMGDLKQVPPEPAVNVSVIDAVQWTTYVDSVLCELDPEKEKPGLMGTLGKTAVDSFKKNVFFWSNLADHKVWGAEKNGAILFSSGPVTHVLDREIYRANVDFSQTVEYGANDIDVHRGFTDQIHVMMKN